MKTPDFPSITVEQWHTLDDLTLARKLRTTAYQVKKQREVLGHPKVRKPGSGRQRTVPLSSFKLDKTNTWNAQHLKISKTWAGKMRKQIENSTDSV